MSVEAGGQDIRIGVISDTHGLLRPEALDALSGSEHIIHAGDIGDPDIIPRLASIAPVTAIRGNIDRQTWAEEFPETLSICLGGRKIYLIHDVKTLGFDPEEAGIDIVIAGHSHRPVIERKERVLYLNPGSAGKKRFSLPITVATMTLEGGSIEASIIDLPV